MTMQKTITTRRLITWLQREQDSSVANGDSKGAAAFWLVKEELLDWLSTKGEGGQR